MRRRKSVCRARFEKVREDGLREVIHIALALNVPDDLIRTFRLIYRKYGQVEIDLLDIHQMRFHCIPEHTADPSRDVFERSLLVGDDRIKLARNVVVAAHIGDHVGQDLVQVLVEPVNAALRQPRLRDDVRYRDHLDGLSEAHLIACFNDHPALVVEIFLCDFRHGFFALLCSADKVCGWLSAVKMKVVSF